MPKVQLTAHYAYLTQVSTCPEATKSAASGSGTRPNVHVYVCTDAGINV